MYGDRVGKRDLVQFAKVVLHAAFVEADRDLMLDGIDALNGSDVTVKYILVIVVFSLDDRKA